MVSSIYIVCISILSNVYLCYFLNEVFRTALLKKFVKKSTCTRRTHDILLQSIINLVLKITHWWLYSVAQNAESESYFIKKAVIISYV